MTSDKGWVRAGDRRDDVEQYEGCLLFWKLADVEGMKSSKFCGLPLFIKNSGNISNGKPYYI